MPLWCHDFLHVESDDFGLVWLCIKDTTIPRDDGYEEQRSCQISEESYGPVQEHFPDGESSLKDRDRGDHE